MRLGLGLSITGRRNATAALAALTMAQIATVKRVYQRATTTGGGQGLGQGSVALSISGATAGAVWARCRAEDGTTILQAPWQLGNVTGGQTTLTVSGVDARLGWFYLDILTASGWQNGTTLIGMGRVVVVTGQSLAVRMLGSVADTTTMASLGVTISTNCRVYATYNDSLRPAGGQTASWVAPADGTDYDSAFLGEFLRLEVTRVGVNCAVIGHAVGATTISTWVPGGANNAALRAVLDGAGGFEAAIWFQGHSDAAVGTSRATYKTALGNLFADLTSRNVVRGSSYEKLLCAIPNISSGSWGTQAQRDEIRQAHLEWASANGGLYSIPMDIGLFDGVHQTQAGSVTLARRWSAGFGGTAVTAPALTMTTPAYQTGGTGFGQEISGGYGILAQASTEATQGGVWSIEGWIRISGAPAGTRVAFGASQWGWIGTAADGRLIANYYGGGADVYINGGNHTGGSTNPVITDGVRRHVRLCVDTDGAYLFLDGALIGSAATAATALSRNSGIAVNTFPNTPASFQWPGSVDEIAIWATCKSRTAFTKPSAPYTGSEIGLVGLYRLESNGNGVMAA